MQIATDIHYKALMDMSSSLNGDDEVAVRFINLLSNIDWPKQNLSEIEQHIFPMILDLTCSKELSYRFWLCWLSGRSVQTLKFFLQYQTKQGFSGLRSQRYRAAIGLSHFIEDITYENCQIDVKRALFISHLVNDINSLDSLSMIKIDEQFNNTFENGFTKSLSFELKRLLLLSSSLTYFVPKFSNCYNVIDALAKEFDFANCNPERINTLLLENYRNNQHIPLLMTTAKKRNSECDLFDSFMIIRMFLEIILDQNNDTDCPTAAQTKQKDIKTRLRNIYSTTAYIEALKASYSLLFLRWEHIEHVNLDRKVESGSESDSNSTDTRGMHQQKIDKHGFVCTMDHVEVILKILKLSISKKNHSDHISDTFGERFQQISNQINDAAWRLTLFRTELVNLKRLPINTIKYLTMHKTPSERKSSSDEDDRIEIDRKSDKKTATRRKPRKRHINRSSPVKASNGINSSSDRRCIVSKMLGSPQHLVIACMNKSDTETSRQIIKMHHLELSVMAAELTFTDLYNQTKSKLKQIYAKYEQEEACKPCYDELAAPSTSPSKATVDRIKKVAAIGFEASKITNIIARFAQENSIKSKITTNDAQMLDKFQTKYTYLNLYRPDELQATIVVDMALSLTNNYDICYNIFNMLTKLWNKSGTMDRLDPHIGYYKFIKNLLDCLRLHKTAVKRILYDEAVILSVNELNCNRQRFYQWLNQQVRADWNGFEKLKAMQKQFESVCIGELNLFNRLFSYIQNVTRLMQQTTNSSRTPTQLLQLNMTTTIGQIVFDCNIAPTEIESLVCSVNLNLVHVLIQNTCGLININTLEPKQISSAIDVLIANKENDNENDDFAKMRGTSRVANEAVVEYIRKHNPMIAYLLMQIQNFCRDNESYTLFKNLLELSEVFDISIVYNGNMTMSALNFDQIDVVALVDFIRIKQNYRSALRCVRSLKELSQKNDSYHNPIKILQNWIIQKVILEPSLQPQDYELFQYLSNIHQLANCLLDHILKIESSDLALRLIRIVLLHRNSKDVKPQQRIQLVTWLHNIGIYTEISEGVTNTSWPQVMKLSDSNPEQILSQMIALGKYELCERWSQIHPLTAKPSKFEAITNIFIEAVLNDDAFNAPLFKLIESLPSEEVACVYSRLLPIRCFSKLKYILEYLISNAMDVSVYQKYRISLIIFQLSPANDVSCMWPMFDKPLLIIEQYLMNSRFETLALILATIKSLIVDEQCKFCSGQRENTNCDINEYVIFHSDITVGKSNNCISVDCIDTLLRIYASKALDFRIVESKSSTADMPLSLINETTVSLDSLCGVFITPREAVVRANWIRDDEASHCMCCRRSVFTILTRRHHCRQCGRVVCHACSTKRIAIVALYSDVLVRACDDCYRQTELKATAIANGSSRNPGTPNSVRTSNSDIVDWKFTGNARHDELLRDEFSYEYAPSVSLCLSILAIHSSTPECVNFLLHHCRKFETLLRPLQPGYPNPEVDYTLVTRMLHCLALAAKVRGGPPACDMILEHTEIFRSIVQHRCESLLPMEPPTGSIFRKLHDALVVVEKWQLALEVSHKCGFATTGVMAAWGIACLKAGCFETAREKFAYCLSKTGTDDDLFKIFTIVSYESNFDVNKLEDLPKIKRPLKSPPLLTEIVHILEVTCHPTQPNVMLRANQIIDSNTSLSSSKSKRRDIPCHEPALNILHTISNLRQITQGSYGSTAEDLNTSSSAIQPLVATSSVSCSTSTQSLTNRQNAKLSTGTLDVKRLTPSSRFYDECLYYLTAYGNHNDIVAFLVKHDQILTALKYCIYQTVDSDIFIHTLFVPQLRRGRASSTIAYMIELDESLFVWKAFIIPLCRYLERKGFLNCLYHLQILFKDPIRASMTCVQFYFKDCRCYMDLQVNTFHLINAQTHLQIELELCQWEEIRTGSATATATTQSGTKRTLLMKMDSRTLNSHINTVCRQMEVTKFLAKCEEDGRDTVKLLPKICVEAAKLPTLFGTVKEKIQLTVLTLICGINIEEAFGLAYRIIQDFNLSTSKVYSITAKYLAGNGRLEAVEQLVCCIKSNAVQADICDEIVALAINTAISVQPIEATIKVLIEKLIRQIADVGIKINCHIVSGQLKSAYLLAVQNNRLNDVRKVLRHAVQTNQTHIKRLCEKKLNINDG